MPMEHAYAGRRQSGFTLVELMVAMVLGLIVMGAVLALSLAMIRANSDTISSTRLTQELRAAAAAITSELQRAGSVANPLDLTAAAAIGGVDDGTAGCIRYSYSYMDGNTLQTVNRAISRSGDAIYVGAACGATGTKLSSDTVDITDLQFVHDGRTVAITLTGSLALRDGLTVSRQYSQTIFAPGLPSGT
jgi:prepilin-type N-terminal cleavage/methylation domain-containing protein